MIKNPVDKMCSIKYVLSTVTRQLSVLRTTVAWQLTLACPNRWDSVRRSFNNMPVIVRKIKSFCVRQMQFLVLAFYILYCIIEGKLQAASLKLACKG